MELSQQPFVSVITPVYNGAPFLEECIESVLAQTYANFEYILIDNASTDGTGAIVDRYAAKDNRIRAYHNPELLPIIANHNKGFSLISPDSKYCKVVSGDDWLFSEYLERVVELAKKNPSVGLIGAYQLSGGGADGRNWSVRWDQLPFPSTVIRGRELCRYQFLNGVYVFGTPTSLTYRADLVRKHSPFYPNSTAEADTSACYNILRECDFGFVHQVLSYERIHAA